MSRGLASFWNPSESSSFPASLSSFGHGSNHIRKQMGLSRTVDNSLTDRLEDIELSVYGNTDTRVDSVIDGPFPCPYPLVFANAAPFGP